MTISFVAYCTHLDINIVLMTEEEFQSARKSYSEFIRSGKSLSELKKHDDALEEAKKTCENYSTLTRYEKTTSEIKKHNKALEKTKESRKLAKFYGGKALTGSAAQKKWAEEIRQNILESSELSDDTKTKLCALSIAQSAKFWIDNKDKKATLFNIDVIVAEHRNLCELYNKHNNTLVRTASAQEKELARKEIYEALSNLTIYFRFDFPNCNFYDNFGNLIKGLKFRC